MFASFIFFWGGEGAMPPCRAASQLSRPHSYAQRCLLLSCAHSICAPLELGALIHVCIVVARSLGPLSRLHTWSHLFRSHIPDSSLAGYICLESSLACTLTVWPIALQLSCFRCAQGALILYVLSWPGPWSRVLRTHRHGATFVGILPKSSCRWL